MTFSLIRLGKFSIITFSNRFSIPYSSSASSIPIIRMLLHFMLSCSSLTTCSFFLSPFSFSLSIWVFFSALSSSLLIGSSASSKPAFDYFYCVLQLRNCILHFLLALVDSFYFLFHVDTVCSEFILVSL